MCRFGLRCVSPGAMAALGVVLILAARTRADDGDPRARVLELNKITGADPLLAKVRELKANPELAKKLVQAGLPVAKEKGALHYNAALVLAHAAADLKDLKAGEVYYRLCMQQAAKLQSTKKLLESYGGLIDLLYDSKKFNESVRVCRELLELKMDDGKPRIVLGPITNRFGDIDYVEIDFDAAGLLKPGVHRLLIQAITKQGKYDQAIKLVENLIKDRDHWMERQLKAWVLNEAGRFSEAAKTYEDVIDRVKNDKSPRLQEEDREFYLYRYRYLLSHIYVDLKHIDRASEHLQALLKKKPDDPGLHNDLGYIWADHDVKLEEAEKLIRKALDLDRKRRQDLKKVNPDIEDKDNGAYLDSLGWVLFKQKKYKEAKEWLLKALEDKSSQHIEIYDHLGDVHMALGERAAALAAWRKGLEVVGEGRREMERKTAVEKKLEKFSPK